MQDFEILFLSSVAVLDKSENSWFVDLWPKGTFNHWDLDRTPYKESTEADWEEVAQKKIIQNGIMKRVCQKYKYIRSIRLKNK